MLLWPKKKKNWKSEYISLPFEIQYCIQKIFVGNSFLFSTHRDIKELQVTQKKGMSINSLLNTFPHNDTF